jgi:3-deoxy-D-manno-octulosonate 8-phosphate phosphatase (KDO 8-P phosphatase)
MAIILRFSARFEQMPSLKISCSDQIRRAGRIKLILTDVDGVLTDTGVYYSSTGEELKRFSIRDGMGVVRLRAVGIETGIVTQEKSPIVLARARKLSLKHVYLGSIDKRATLETLLRKSRLSLSQLAYIGDDVNDAGIMDAIAPHGLTATPSDGLRVAADRAHYRCAVPGGHGAFRDFAEWILDLRKQR